MQRISKMQGRDFVTQSVPLIGEHYLESLNGPESLKLCRDLFYIYPYRRFKTPWSRYISTFMEQ